MPFLRALSVALSNTEAIKGHSPSLLLPTHHHHLPYTSPSPSFYSRVVDLLIEEDLFQLVCLWFPGRSRTTFSLQHILDFVPFLKTFNPHHMMNIGWNAQDEDEKSEDEEGQEDSIQSETETEEDSWDN